MNIRSLLVLSRILFFLGIVLGLALTVIAIWNNTEATNYYFTGAPYPPFHGLSCPLLMTSTEKGIVTVTFDNPADQEDIYRYRVEISNKISSPRTIEDQIAVPSRQSKNIQWTVDANDIDLRFFILVKITVLPNAFHATQEDVCGILVTNIPVLTVTHISAIALFLSFFGITAGLGLWQWNGTNTNHDRLRLAQALGLTVLLAMLATAMGWWVIAIALSVITILLLIISLRFAID